MTAKLTTEKVTENAEVRPGRMTQITFWIAYPSYVGALGLMSDRVAQASGRGRTRREALAAAQVGVLRDQLDRWRSAEPAGTLYDYDTAEPIRPATADELAASSYAAEHKDAGQGVIDVDGRRCYVLADA